MMTVRGQSGLGDMGALAQAIVDTVREPLPRARQGSARRCGKSFYLTFRVTRQETQGRMLYALGDGQWDIPALRTLLEKIVPEGSTPNLRDTKSSTSSR